MTKALKPGDKVVISDKAHPWHGKAGEYVEHQKTFVGTLAVVKLDNGISCMARDPQIKGV